MGAHERRKTQTLRSLLLVAAATAATFAFTSCEPSPPEPPRSSTEPTSLKLIIWKPNQPEVWGEVYRRFAAQHPEIRLEREIGPHSSTAFHDLLTQKLKNRSRDVDVFLMDVIWPPEFAAAGWAEPLGDRFPPKDQGAFFSGAILANTYEEQIYGVPLYVDSGVLYYRRDLLEKYGHPVPETWPELVSQARDVVEREAAAESQIEGYSGQFKQYEGLVCDMLEFILSNGGHILDPQTGEVALDQPAAVEAVTFVRDRIIGETAPRGVLTYQEPESLTLFTQGRAVFLRSWPYAWEISNNPEKSRIDGKVGLAPLPHFPGGESHSTLGGWQVGISRFSEKKDAAWTFVRFLTSEPIQKLLAVDAGLAPTRKALYEDPEVLASNPHFASMKKVFSTAYPRPRTPVYPAVSNVLQRYFSKAIAEPDSDVQALADDAAREIERLMSLTR